MRTVRLTVGLEVNLTMANLLEQQRYITDVIAPAARKAASGYPRAHQMRSERQDGYNMLHGRPHGFKWRPIYSVTVEFESAEKAQEFFESLHESGIVTSNVELRGCPTHDTEKE